MIVMIMMIMKVIMTMMEKTPDEQTKNVTLVLLALSSHFIRDSSDLSRSSSAGML
jgi:hypothetical protein